MNYDLELDRVEKVIRREKARKILIQLPDGLKMKAAEIVDELEKRLRNVEFYVWFGSCFGACDVPDVNENEVDLIIQFGHSAWDYRKDSGIKVVK